MNPLIIEVSVNCFTKTCQDSTLVWSTAEKGMAGDTAFSVKLIIALIDV